jgi:hypothetical protein
VSGWNAFVVKLESLGDRVRCELRDGRSVLLPSAWAQHVRIADRLHVEEAVERIERTTPFYLERRQLPDLCQIAVVAAGRPKINRRGIPIVSLDVADRENGLARVFLSSAQIRDYFFAADRTQPWHTQSSWYELLGVSKSSTPPAIRLSCQMRQLELKMAGAHSGAPFAQLARGFQILMDPELRDHYLALLDNADYPVPFPPHTVGSLLAAGQRRQKNFLVDRLLRFVPLVKRKTVRVPLRKLRYFGSFATYRNSRRKILIRLDAGVLPLSWTKDWNEWAHLTHGSIQVTSDFWQQTKFRRREGSLEPVVWQIAAISTLAVKLPIDLTRKVEQARNFWERFRPHADKLALLRSRIECEPVAVSEAQQWCRDQELPAGIDVRRLNWYPDYEEHYYRELASRAEQIYLFRNEYLFVLQNAIVAEIPLAGHASYVFRPPGTLAQFLRAYAQTTRHEIRRDPATSRKKLGYRGRLPHVHDSETWLRSVQQRCCQV